ncbi:MAG: hypothetical protein OEW94_13235 [Betaproteobacteria bacterium]|nr:hypothetical protein [Betaproteobacteria bacterium]MDH5350944.1 hypothetical protein [Betaproteobacteria bacterium]
MGAALQRRDFLSGSAALAAGALLPLGALAQSSGRIQALRGEVRVNGKRIGADAVIRTGDLVQTLADGFVLFAVGSDAFMLRAGSELRLAPGPEPFFVTGLRVLTGALGAVFGRRAQGDVRIVTPTVTAGIRGTGCYVEARHDSTYFCTCYGTIAMASNANPRERVTATTRHHDAPQLFYATPRQGSYIAAAAMETHGDDELEALEKAVGRRPPWK